MRKSKSQLLVRSFAVATTVLLSLMFMSPSAFAYYTVQDTGDLIKPNQVAFGTSLQWITQGNTQGIDLLGHADIGFNNASNFRVEAGAGATDAILGADYKWVPFPDYQQQPAVGFIFGAQYAHYHGAAETAARFVPIASKTFQFSNDSVSGVVTPYVALPIAVSTYDSHTTTPVEITLGARYHDSRITQCDFLAEIDFDVNQAPDSIVFGAQFDPF